jgi:transposase-like protein
LTNSAQTKNNKKGKTEMMTSTSDDEPTKMMRLYRRGRQRARISENHATDCCTPMKRNKKRGRKSLFNARLQRKVCGLLAQGHTISAVCGAVGVGERTFYDWLEKRPHFSQAATRAIGQSKIALLDKLRLSDDWRAQAFLLERRWPSEFGKVEPRAIQPSTPVLSDGAADYGMTATTLRTMLALAAGNPEKIERLRLTLNEVEAENRRLSNLIEQWRANGLL